MEDIDNYSTCHETSVTLRIFTDDMTPQEITEALGIEPSFVHVKGEPGNKERPESNINKTNCWFLSSEHIIQSKDTRRHIEWVLSKLSNCHKEFKQLHEKGISIDLFCPWESKENQGGPTMDPHQMKLLGELQIVLKFEFWFSGDDK